jgi:hypothetical protein
VTEVVQRARVISLRLVLRRAIATNAISPIEMRGQSDWELVSGSRGSFIELYWQGLHPDADHRVDLLRCGMTRSEGAQLTDGVDAMHLVPVQRLGVRGGLTGAAT